LPNKQRNLLKRKVFYCSVKLEKLSKICPQYKELAVYYEKHLGGNKQKLIEKAIEIKECVTNRRETWR